MSNSWKSISKWSKMSHFPFIFWYVSLLIKGKTCCSRKFSKYCTDIIFVWIGQYLDPVKHLGTNSYACTLWWMIRSNARAARARMMKLLWIKGKVLASSLLNISSPTKKLHYSRSLKATTPAFLHFLYNTLLVECLLMEQHGSTKPFCIQPFALHSQLPR